MEVRKLALWLGLAPAVLGASLFAACGGGGGTGSDEEFVADLCDIMKNFAEDIDDVETGDIKNEEDAFAAFAEPFEKLADDFADLKPPSDLKDWHEEASDSLNEAADAIKDGDLNADIFSGDSPLPSPPKDAEERLTKIAEDNEDCEDADLGF